MSPPFWGPADRRSGNRQPADFPNNGWVVHALQTAWWAITHADGRRPDAPAGGAGTGRPRRARHRHDRGHRRRVARRPVGRVGRAGAVAADAARLARPAGRDLVALGVT